MNNPSKSGQFAVSNIAVNVNHFINASCNAILHFFNDKHKKSHLRIASTPSIPETWALQWKKFIITSPFALPHSFSRHLIFYSFAAKLWASEKTVKSVVECDFRKIKHLSYFRSYHWKWQKCDKGEYFHRTVLKQKRQLPHCCCSFNMYLKLINFSKTCSRKERRTLWRRLLVSDSNFTPLKLSVSRNEPTPTVSLCDMLEQ